MWLPAATRSKPAGGEDSPQEGVAHLGGRKRRRPCGPSRQRRADARFDFIDRERIFGARRTRKPHPVFERRADASPNARADEPQKISGGVRSSCSTSRSIMRTTQSQIGRASWRERVCPYV